MRSLTLMLPVFLAVTAMSGPVAAEVPSAQASWPELAGDQQRIEAVTSAYNKGKTSYDVTVIRQLSASYEDDLAWSKQVRSKYKALLAEQGSQADLYWDLDKLDMALSQYAASVKRRTGKQIKTVVRNLEQLQQKADLAVANANPHLLGRSLADSLAESEESLEVIAALLGEDHPDTRRLRMQYETSRVAIEACLRDLIMTDAKDTRAPKEIYGGPSKEAWRAGIRTTWTETWPEDDILAIRFHDTSWELRQEIVWENGAWHKVDMKYLYAKVIVDSGDGLATMYIAVVNVDQTRGGAVSYGVHTKKSGFKIEYMLKKNL